MTSQFNFNTNYKESLLPLPEDGIQRTKEADPNSGRCLIENDEEAELTYAVPREFSGDDSMMLGFEWAWDMRMDTLNLDRPDNIFFLGPKLHHLFKEYHFCLLPEEHIIKSFLQGPLGHSGGRLQFPHHTAPTYQYTFLPVPSQEMKNLLIKRKGDPGDVTDHEYPFKFFPKLTSHIHPMLAIARIGLCLDVLPEPMYMEWCRKYPILEKIDSLTDEWMQIPAAFRDDARIDISFLPLGLGGEKDESEGEDPSERLPFKKYDAFKVVLNPRARLLNPFTNAIWGKK